LITQLPDYTQIINSNSDQFKPVAYCAAAHAIPVCGITSDATPDLLKAIELTIDPQVRAPAAAALRDLGYNKQVPENQTPAAVTVFLQYIDARDGDVVDAIGADLQNNGFDGKA
jgi:hypothetical protein